MFQFSAHSRRATAATFLVVFLNVLFGQLVCAMAMLPTVGQAPAAGLSHQHAPGTAPHHHESAAGATDHDHAAAGHSHHHEEKNQAPQSHKRGAKDSCCHDDAASVWASLAHPPKVGIEKSLALVVALPPAPTVLVARFQRWDRTGSVLLVARRQLKPKIPDIRIFIQSLTV
jgi:hypothetical protein